MNKCIFQFWEESSDDNNSVPDGCSLHTTDIEFKNYVENLYSNRLNSEIPNQYSKFVGNSFDCFVSDELFERLFKSGTIRLNEVEKNNLIQLEEIFFKE